MLSKPSQTQRDRYFTLLSDAERELNTYTCGYLYMPCESRRETEEAGGGSGQKIIKAHFCIPTLKFR